MDSTLFFGLSKVMVASLKNERLIDQPRHRPAVFLDRDQTLTVDHGYTHLVADFAWMPGAKEALRLFKRRDIDCFIVTNQGGIGRDIFTIDQMLVFNNHLVEQARLVGGNILDIAY
jgi:D-glycero-D-manno-heptose 1,7-bisphosphate phosphatase